MSHNTGIFFFINSKLNVLSDVNVRTCCEEDLVDSSRGDVVKMKTIILISHPPRASQQITAAGKIICDYCSLPARESTFKRTQMSTQCKVATASVHTFYSVFGC